MITLRRPSPEEYVYYPGAILTVEWYYTELGSMPAWEYYQRMDQDDRDRLDCVVAFIADQPIGTIFPKTMYRVEDKENKIYAFKPRDERFFNFTTKGRKVIITNAYHKHSQQMSKLDLNKLETAVKYREDYLRRLLEGTYYEDQD